MWCGDGWSVVVVVWMFVVGWLVLVGVVFVGWVQWMWGDVGKLVVVGL